MTEEIHRADLVWGTIPRLLRAVAAERPDHDAVIDARRRLSYRDLDVDVRRLAAGLVEWGIEPGDRVAIWAPNIWEWPVACLGLQSAGAVLVPLNTRYKGIEAAHILERSGARVLFCIEGFLGNEYASMLADADLPALEHVVIMRGEHPDRAPAPTTSFEGLLDAGTPAAASVVDQRVADQRPDDLSDLLFTSGTTGAPKGVMCTHGQAVRVFDDWSRIVGLRGDDRYLIVNPFFHSFGYKAGIVASLTKGATMVPEPVFDVAAVMERIAEEGISMIPGPPTLYQSILNSPDLDTSRLATLRLAVTGAAPVPTSLLAQMRDVLGFETVLTAYGLTEACGVVSMCREDDPPEIVSATSGRAIPDVEIRVVDPDGEEVPRRDLGEIIVRGYNIMLGYFDDPERTAEAIDEDGWLHTGDIGWMDEHGNIDITDRLKDMYIVGGFNAYPAEIESLLTSHPAVAAAAVIGVPDERLGEVGHAAVIPVVGEVLEPEDLIAWARDNMANFKVPRTVEVVDEFPLNASGKVLKTELLAAVLRRMDDSKDPTT